MGTCSGHGGALMQFEFYCSWTDSWKILDDLLSHGFKLIPDMRYPSCDLTIWSSIGNDERAQLMRKRRLFLWRPGMELPVLEPLTDASNDVFEVIISAGPPVLDLVLPACFKESALVYLNTGMLAVPSSFGSPSDRKNRKESTPTKQAYLDAKEILAQQMIRLAKKVFIGRDAHAMLANGEAKLIGFLGSKVKI